MSTAQPSCAGLTEVERLFADLRAGQPRALARAISWVENDAPQAAALLELVYAQAPHPWVVGVTGVGGVGKSSLVPHLARSLANTLGKVAILAVDPSSPLSGGALLGDRIRDAYNRQPERVYFRSVASRGGQGGLATCVADLVRVTAAAGHDVVLIETVGAGQSELGILEVAHSIVLVSAPGLGDDVQAQKAGVMEVADIVVMNKADRPGAEDAMAALRQALQLSERHAHLRDGVNELEDGGPLWHPPVLPTVAPHATGVGELCVQLLQHRGLMQRTGALAELNTKHDLQRMQARLLEIVQQRLRERLATMDLGQVLAPASAGHQVNPLAAARWLADVVMPETHQDPHAVVTTAHSRQGEAR